MLISEQTLVINDYVHVSVPTYVLTSNVSRRSIVRYHCDGNGQHTGQEPLNRVEMTMSQLDVDGFPISWKDPEDADTVSMFDVIYGKVREVCVFNGHVGDV